MATHAPVTRLDRIVAALVRAWTWALTRIVPAESAAARRAEIESDLWEWQQDAAVGTRPHAWQTLGRLVRGLWDDLAWACHEGDHVRRTVAGAVLVAVAGTSIWYRAASTEVVSLPPSPAPLSASQLWDFAPPQPFPSAPPPPPSRPHR